MAKDLGAVVLRSVIWRCLLLIPIALFAGQGMAHPTSQCSNSTAASGDPVYAAKQTQMVKGANEARVWKTINVGGSKGVNAIRVAMETAPCSIWFSEEADEILGRPAFPFIKAPVELDLVVLRYLSWGLVTRLLATTLSWEQVFRFRSTTFMSEPFR